MSLDLVKRSEVGAPLTAVQHDANLTAIETAVNANEAAIGTKETPVGAQAKADAAQTAAIAAAALDATTKANAAQVAAIATAATDATTKANAAQAASLPVNDPSVSNSREWTAPTATQVQAEDSGGTIRLAWTAQRVWQAIAAWWAASAMKTKLDGIAAGATANATDAQLRDRSTHTGTQAASTISDFSTAADARISAAAGVSIASLSGGKIPAAQIPDIAISDYLGAAANQAAMLALSGQKGDWCVRTDLGTTWIITGTDPTLLAGWTQLSYPTAPVTSVASKTGAVTLAAADIADSTAAGRAIMTAADAAAQRTALGLGTAATTAATAYATAAQGTDARTPSGPGIAALTEDTTPQDADNLPLADSTASNAAKRITWATIKSALTTVFNALYASRGAVGSSNLTMSTARLLGRSTAGTGALEEITLGTNLSFTGTTLNAAGGGVQNNYAATAAPTSSNDSTQGYDQGSEWVWAARGLKWQCMSASAGAAFWLPLAKDYLALSQPTGPALALRFNHFQETGGSGLTYTDGGSTAVITQYTSGLDGLIGILSLRTAANATVQQPTFYTNRTCVRTGTTVKSVISARVRMQPAAAPSAPSATNDYQFSIGFQGANTSREPSDYARFDYRWDGSAAVFQARRRAASGTVQTVNVTYPGANTWAVLAVAIADNLVEFWVNGVLILSANTSVPAIELREQAFINQTTAAAVCGVDLDWVAFWTEGMP